MINISSLTLEEKILQTKVALMKKGEKLQDKPGAAFFFGQIITEADDAGLDELRKYVDEIYADADIPPLITSDFENGCGSMVKGLTQLPYMMGLGATNDPQLAYDYGKATAMEARTLGANWTFSPVSDLNINKRNPLVNVRGLTDNTELAEKILPQIVAGMQDGGIAACAKHFPGDGIDWRDQHIVTTENTLPLNEWRDTYGKVFKTLIDNGVMSIMAGHISLPAYQKERDAEFGLAYPATLSHELITKLLKEELGFGGVVVTDALGMGGFLKWYDTREEAEIESFKAGCDMMLWPTDNYVPNMIKAIESGYISMERLDDAVTRILNLKEKLGLFDKTAERFKILTEEEKAFINQTKEKAFEKSITLMRDTQGLLPVDRTKVKKISLVPITNYSPAMEIADHLAERLKAEGFEVIYRSSISPKEQSDDANEADLVINAMFSRSFRPMGFLDFWDSEASKIANSLKTGRKKSINVSFGSPYFFTQYFEHSVCFVNAYSMLNGAVDAFVDAFLGKKPFYTFSPVNVN